MDGVNALAHVAQAVAFSIPAGGSRVEAAAVVFDEDIKGFWAGGDLDACVGGAGVFEVRIMFKSP